MNQKVTILSIVVLILIITAVGIFLAMKRFRTSEPKNFPKGEAQQEKSLPEWQYGGLAIEGTFADAEIIPLPDGRWRMYYSEEPETPGFEGKVYSAVSLDGKNWLQESGVRIKWATFPSLLLLSDGKYRMYFQNQGVIKSAISADGLTWNEEAGVRIDTINSAGLNLENVAAPTVAKVGDEYIMVYRVTINQKYSTNLPNNNTQLFLWATSRDGLDFEKKGIALDSRDAVFQGLLDGAEFVKWNDDQMRLYFWSYRGIYHTIFKDGQFSTNSEFDYTTASNSKNPFPENPPCDPTLAYINGVWFIYYGQHKQGIHYLSLQ